MLASSQLCLFPFFLPAPSSPPLVDIEDWGGTFPRTPPPSKNNFLALPNFQDVSWSGHPGRGWQLPQIAWDISSAYMSLHLEAQFLQHGTHPDVWLLLLWIVVANDCAFFSCKVGTNLPPRAVTVLQPRAPGTFPSHTAAFYPLGQNKRRELPWYGLTAEGGKSLGITKSFIKLN